MWKAASYYCILKEAIRSKQWHRCYWLNVALCHEQMLRDASPTLHITKTEIWSYLVFTAHSKWGMHAHCLCPAIDHRWGICLLPVYPHHLSAERWRVLVVSCIQKKSAEGKSRTIYLTTTSVSTSYLPFLCVSPVRLISQKLPWCYEYHYRHVKMVNITKMSSVPLSSFLFLSLHNCDAYCTCMSSQKSIKIPNIIFEGIHKLLFSLFRFFVWT